MDICRFKIKIDCVDGQWWMNLSIISSDILARFRFQIKFYLLCIWVILRQLNRGTPSQDIVKICTGCMEIMSHGFAGCQTKTWNEKKISEEHTSATLTSTPFSKVKRSISKHSDHWVDKKKVYMSITANKYFDMNKII